MCPSDIFSEYLRSRTVFFFSGIGEEKDNNHRSGTKWPEILVFCGCCLYCRLWIVLLTLC